MKITSISNTLLLLAFFCMCGCSDQEAPNNTAPVLNLGTAEVTGRTSASLSGTIAFIGATDIAEYGFMYSTLSALPEEGSTFVPITTGSLPGSCSVELTGLTPGTTYYYCLYANSGYTTQRSETGSFTTAESGPPTFSNTVYSDVTESTVTLQATLEDNGGYAINTLGFCYKLQVEGEDPEDLSRTDQLINVDVPDSLETSNVAFTFTATLTDLTPNSTYVFRAYGINGQGTLGYGEVKTFTTQSLVEPVVSNVIPIDSTDVSITVEAQIVDDGGRNITEVGFCWSSEYESPNISMMHQACETESGIFRLTISDLSTYTTYNIRAYAINDQQQEGYSETYKFTTKGNMVVATHEAVEITDTSARLTGEITSENYEVLKAKGFLYGTNANITETGERIEDSTWGNTFTTTLNDLEIGVTYYFCAFAETSANQMVYGEVKSFTTTITLPVFSTPVVTEIRDVSAFASVTVSNGVSLNHYGYELSTVSLPSGEFGSASTLAYGEGYSGSNFTATLSNLQSGTTYYLRAWGARGKTNGNTGTIDPATVDIGYYAFSETVTFTTDEAYVAPTIGNITITNVTTTRLSLAATIISNGNSAITEKGFCYTTDDGNPPTTDDSKVTSYGSTDEISGTISGLVPNTVYYIRAYANNGYETGYSEVLAVKTLNNSPGIDDNPSPDLEEE